MNTINSFIHRRYLLKYVGIGGVSMLLSSQTFPSRAFTPPTEVYAANSNPTSSDEALKRLIDGNKRFAQQKRTYPDQSQMQIKAVSQAQHPFAALSCADSRVPPELIFDEGIGDIFDIRIPGNIATLEVVGSLEYAVEVLDTRLILVLGHERCGAVSAAVKGEKLPGHISSLIKFVQPSLAISKSKSGDAIDNAVIANVNYQMEQIKKNSPLINRRLSAKMLKIVGSRYDLDTGEVRILT